MIDSLHLCLPCHICYQYSFRVDHPVSKYWNHRHEWIVFLCVISSIMCGQRTLHCIERKCHFQLLHRLRSFTWNTICLLALCHTTSTPPLKLNIMSLIIPYFICSNTNLIWFNVPTSVLECVSARYRDIRGSYFCVWSGQHGWGWTLHMQGFIGRHSLSWIRNAFHI